MKALYQYKFQFPCKTPCTVDRKSQSARIEAKGRITLEILKALVAAVLLIQELMRVVQVTLGTTAASITSFVGEISPIPAF